MPSVSFPAPTDPPPGLPPMPAEAQAFRRRAVLIDATVREAALRGYGEVSVAGITTRAGVSEQAFYEQFSGKDEALVHAYDIAVAYAVPRIQQAIRAASNWERAVAAALGTYLAILDCDHAWALVCLREMVAAGEQVRQARDALRAPIIETLSGLPESGGAGGIGVETVVTALDAIAIDGLRHQPGRPLVERQRELTQFVLAPFSDGPVPEPVGVPAAHRPLRGRQVNELIAQGSAGVEALSLLVRAAAARRDGPALWHVVVGLQRRRAAGAAIDEELLRLALGGLADAWFFGLSLRDDESGESDRGAVTERA